MSFKLELPEDTILINRTELKEALQEMWAEVLGEYSKEEIMTINEAADYLKVSVPTVRNMIASREIPYFQRGQVIRLNRWEVSEWMRKNSRHYS
ncbi:helix-turn-helix domain-containing protein [Bacillus sp. FJAT-44742]|uniref:helix-turn-helix domain-containing protein n=1 Tax=Bacillus sp. FJAT-44742 TaxID=2014005 RepID=UPI000C239814|nr:helix-turn-helix domain-containing protein [Bacillus sp. FJAT-44742]